MASGIFQRPLPDPTDEKTLLGLNAITTMKYTQSASTTRYATFKTEVKSGILVLSAGGATKHGLYIFGSTSAGAIGITAIHAPSQSGMNVNASGQTITVSNGSTNLYWLILMWNGDLPTISTTAPA